jgi:hypothetical protein
MLNRIIRIMATAAACALLLAGCSIRLDDPALTKAQLQDGAIGFSAGSALLLDDALPTKSGSDLKTAFAVNDNFYVYGAKVVSGTRYTVFNGQSVGLTSLGADALDPLDDVWEYSPLRFWDSNATQYDFVAISGPATSAGISSDPAAAGHLRASVTFDATSCPCDIMAAGHLRTDGSITPVNFEFNHILSAVRVTIINDSPAISVTVSSYGFRNICYRAIGTVEQSGRGLSTMGTSDWGTPSYTSSTILGHSASPGIVLAQGEEFAMTADKWDLMVPQELAPYGDYIPQLMLDYEYDQVNPYTEILEHNHPVFPIRLEEITVKNSEELITSWLPGKKYSYEIHIRLGGGIIANVAVTDWQEVLAETPGLTIDDE